MCLETCQFLGISTLQEEQLVFNNFPMRMKQKKFIVFPRPNGCKQKYNKFSNACGRSSDEGNIANSVDNISYSCPSLQSPREMDSDDNGGDHDNILETTGILMLFRNSSKEPDESDETDPNDNQIPNTCDLGSDKGSIAHDTASTLLSFKNTLSQVKVAPLLCIPVEHEETTGNNPPTQTKLRKTRSLGNIIQQYIPRKFAMFKKRKCDRVMYWLEESRHASLEDVAPPTPI